jgi:DNA-directed RNA polymerase subunit RPC12/RpoP
MKEKKCTCSLDIRELYHNIHHIYCPSCGGKIYLTEKEEYEIQKEKMENINIIVGFIIFFMFMMFIFILFQDTIINSVIEFFKAFA